MSAPRRNHTPEEIGQEQLAGRPTPKKNRASWQRGLRKVLSVRLFDARVQRCGSPAATSKGDKPFEAPTEADRRDKQLFARVKGCGSPVATSKGTAFCSTDRADRREQSLPSGCDALRHILLGIIWRIAGGRFAASLHCVSSIPRTAFSA